MASEEEFPWRAEPVPAETLERLVTAFPDYRLDGMAYFGPSRYLAVPDSEHFFQQYYNTTVHEGDIWVVTLPKCGTTWTQELVWLVANDCDFDGAQTMLMPDRWHFLEIAGITARRVREEIQKESGTLARDIFCRNIAERPRPWFVKTHLPLHMCPPKLLDTCKVVYVTRNPKDACVSYFHHMRLYKESSPDLTLQEFVDLFVEGNVSQLPFFPHILEAWQKRKHPNMLFLFFEDLKKDLRGSILRVAEFLGKPLTEDNLNRLEKHLHFSNMKNNKWVNWEWLSTSIWSTDDQNLRFMRKGQTGDWKNHLTPEMSDKIQKWMEDELRDTDLKYVTDIKEN